MSLPRVIVIGPLFVLMLAGTCAPAWTDCSSSNRDVLGWWPMYWDDINYGCTLMGMIVMLQGGAAQQGGTGKAYYHL